MARREYEILRRSDKEIIKALREIKKDLGGSDDAKLHAWIENIAFSTRIGAIEEAKGFSTLLKSEGTVASKFQLQITTIGGASLTVERKVDSEKVLIDFPDQLDLETATLFILAVQKHLTGIENSTSVRKALGKELSDFFSRRELAVGQLEALTQRLIEQNENYRSKIDEDLRAAKNTLEVEKQTFLETNAAQYAEKLAALVQEREALEKREQELDDRGSRHVRRDIRKQFLEKLATREKSFALSKTTNEKRGLIHRLFGLLILGGLALAVYGATAVHASNDPLSYVKLALGVFGATSATIYYIRWSDLWFRQHADEEFRLQRLALDFDRASWVVEMALEWKDEKDQAIPPELLERLTAQLFEPTAASQDSRHPAEEFAANLLGAGSSLKLNLPNGQGELTLDRKAIHRATRQ
jgi:hypothetical protein